MFGSNLTLLIALVAITAGPVHGRPQKRDVVSDDVSLFERYVASHLRHARVDSSAFDVTIVNSHDRASSSSPKDAKVDASKSHHSHLSHLSNLLKNAQFFSSYDSGKNDLVLEHGPRPAAAGAIGGRARRNKPKKPATDAGASTDPAIVVADAAGTEEGKKLVFEREFMPSKANKRGASHGHGHQKKGKKPPTPRRRGAAGGGAGGRGKKRLDSHLSKRSSGNVVVEDWSWMSGTEGEGDEEASDHLERR